MTSTELSVRSHSRRDILTGRPAKSYQIASLLIHSRPTRAETLTGEIGRIAGAEAHKTESPNRLIVTVESESDAGLAEAMSAIADIDGVIAATLVYHQIEEPNDA